MILPILFVLALLGSSLGYTPDQLVGIHVYLSTDQPVTVAAVACDSVFSGIPGNAQARCAGLPDQTALLYADATHWDSRMCQVLSHELRHLIYGADGPRGDPFNEVAAYRVQSLWSMKDLRCVQ